MKILKTYKKNKICSVIFFSVISAISVISCVSSCFAFDYESAYGKFAVVSGQPMRCEQVQKITQACIDSCNKDLSCIESCQNTSKMQVQSNNLKDCKGY